MSIRYVIPSYGKDELTDAIVHQLLDDGVLPADIVVIDNAGSFTPSAGIVPITPRLNLGWLVATDLGMEVAFSDPDCEAVVWLNNDVTLSSGFTAALAASAAQGAWLVGPLYDGTSNRLQHKEGAADLGSFVPADAEREVAWLEGVCILVTRECYQRVGPLDAKHFGWRGWGADVDYALRARDAGGRVVVTEAAFLHHEGGVTAKAVASDYSVGAMREMSLALRRRWGRDWAARYDIPSRQPSSVLGRIRVRIEEYGGIPMRRREIRRRRAEADRLRPELSGPVQPGEVISP